MREGWDHPYCSCLQLNRKLLLPSFAALPLLMAYAGHTTIIIPKPLIPYFGVAVLDLGKNNVDELHFFHYCKRHYIREKLE